MFRSGNGFIGNPFFAIQPACAETVYSNCTQVRTAVGKLGLDVKERPARDVQVVHCPAP